VTDRQQLRVGVVGCGTHGTNLALAAARSGLLQVVACADPDESAAQRVARTAPGLSVHGTIDSLLERASVDAVLIATPHDALASSSLAAIDARKHVMVEKPMAMDDTQAREVESAAVEAGMTCMVGYSLRFSTGKYVHDLIAAGHVGDIEAVTGSIRIPPMNRSWMSTTEHGGGPLLYVGCHLVDFLFWFTGDEAVKVSADVRRRADTATDDLSAIQVTLARGGLAQLLVTQTAAAFGYEMHVHGRAGDIGLRARSLFQGEVEVFSSSTPAFREPATIHPVLRGDAITTMLVPELEEFARSIAENRPPAVTAADGRRVLKILDAAVESARTGQAVEVAQPEPVGR
jgi:myo-inositol 2-dehydrogenase/D-chiro-inositol 1-dehydrogenase